MSGTLRKSIQKKFKIRGYALKVDALDDIVSFLNHFLGDEVDDALDLLLDRIQFLSQKLAVRSSIIGKETTSRVIGELLKADDAVEESMDTVVSPSSALRFVDAFLVPKFRYDPIKKLFYQHNGPLPIHGDASAKAALYKDRFLLLSQRLSRDEHFSRPAFDTEMSHYGSCEIVPIQSLVGQIGKRWVMGLISQLEDGHFYLEDLTASVEIDLSKAKITTGLLSENTIIVAEGEMLPNGTFQVYTCGFPPLEEREKSHKILGQHDFFGGGALEKDEMLALAALEKNAINDMFVVLSDIWLDDEEVMGKLKIVLSGFESQEVVPSLFVFMGNFCSRPCNLAFNSFASLRLLFGKLGQLIESRPRIKVQSRFLFIPGPDDVGPSTVLPRCSLPNFLADELRKHIPNAIFSSNPCRVKFYTQEIVFFRHDLLYRMRRSCLMPLSLEETDDVFKHLVATITHQSHLCPLPLIVQPIIWNYDHALHLYPLPHTIVLGDKSKQKEFKYSEVTCFNPGSFSNDSTFAAYRPCTREVELSAL